MHRRAPPRRQSGCSAHQASPEATFNEEATALQGSTAEQLLYLHANAHADVVRATWSVYQPVFPFTLDSTAGASRSLIAIASVSCAISS